MDLFQSVVAGEEGREVKTEKGKSTHQLLRLIVIQRAVELQEALYDCVAIERLDFGGHHSADAG
jgi:hypothetical protein